MQSAISMKKTLSIVYVGSLDKRSNSYRRFNTLLLLGHQVMGIDNDEYISTGVFSRLHYHLNFGPGIRKLNKEIRACIKINTPDLLLVDNKPYLTANSLRWIKRHYPAIKVANLITDDPTGKYKQTWRLCLQTAALYDVQFVQRAVNIEELRKKGAKRVELCYRSYDPAFHRPIELNEHDKRKFQCAVGFIGTYEAEREEFIAYLIESGISVKVVGDGWPKGKFWNIISPYYDGPSVYGEEYVKRINGMGIALHFLRHVNRDQQDSRTFEIPACGVFMLAERSILHETFFLEHQEAEFFISKEELLQKVCYYLNHETEKKQIALNGFNRSSSSKYDHSARLEKVLEQIFE